ncbi:HAD family hydrolase [Aeromonas veronii]|uniref:HAD family hydrolase n=1 Tax=Aeromonas veronii TaxID=654 RepID=UPI003D1E28B7
MKNECRQDMSPLWIHSDFYLNSDQILLSDPIKVLSLDAFDTLLRRTCDEPAWVFEEAARRVSAVMTLPLEPADYRQCRIEAEKKARKLSAHDDVTLSEIFDCLPLGENEKCNLMNQELEIEREVLYLDPLVAELIKRVKELNKRIIVISDVYLPSVFLTEVIDSLLGVGVVERIYCSSDIKFTKVTGRLFEYVLTAESLSPSEMMHVGDNKYSDIQGAMMYGISAQHYGEPDYILDIIEREKRYNVTFPSTVRHARKLAVMSAPQALSEEAKFFYQYGAFLLGPILIGFSQWAIERVRRLGIGCILALMREGDIISRCINREFLLKGNKERIRCVPCYASRKATFLPALHGREIADGISAALMRKNYTVGDVLAEFGLDEPGLTPYINVRFDRLDSIYIDGISALSYVKNVIESHQDKIKDKILFIKSMLDEYVGLLTEKKSFATIDFGGGATIQHQLQCGLDLPASLNLILYCTARGYGKSTELTVNSFIPYNQTTRRGINLLTRSPEILEIVLVGKKQTTLGYRRNAAGDIVPLMADADYSEQHKDLITAFELGVENYQGWYHTLHGGMAEHNVRESYLKAIERLIEFPTSTEVKYLGKLIHEDNFGSNRSYPLIDDVNKNRLANDGIIETFRKFSKNNSHAQTWLPWPQGTITAIDADFIKEIKGLSSAGEMHADTVDNLVELVSSQEIKEVVIYGAGEFFESLYPELIKRKIRVKLLIDKKAQLMAYKVADINVVPLAKAKISDGEVVLIASAAYVDEIRQDISDAYSGMNIRIISL